MNKKTRYLAILLSSVLLIALIAPAEPDNRLPNEPMQNLISAALNGNPKIFAKNKADFTYLNAFLPQWQQLLSQLFSQDATESHVESFFNLNYELTRKALPAFQKLKPPTDFKEFHDLFSKGLAELSDWSLDMKERIHYAKTPYQKEAYMKKIEGFRTEWYETFFGDSLDELNSAIPIFLMSHWMDDLGQDQLNALNKNSKLKQYLVNFHKITVGQLKATQGISKKVRETREKSKGDDSGQYAENLRKELDDLKKTASNLKKINPPDPFKNLHPLEIAWFDARIRGTEMALQIADASEKHLPDERIQALINQKNQTEQETTRLKADADKAYADAVQSLSPIRQ